MIFVSWNVNGLRARVDHGGFLDFCSKYSPDFVCVQEIKMFPWQKQFNLGDVFEYWNPSSAKGVSGTAIFANRKAISMTVDMGIDMGDDDGRVITLEYPNYYLVTVYVPTGSLGKRGEALRKKLLWMNDLTEYMRTLNQAKPVILCGDMNIAHTEKDLSYPDPKGLGFTDGERAAFSKLLGAGFVDSFRYLHPDAGGRYTWVSNAEKDGGLRLDYFLVSESIKSRIVRAEILRDEAASDHCPILLELDI